MLELKDRELNALKLWILRLPKSRPGKNRKKEKKYFAMGLTVNILRPLFKKHNKSFNALCIQIKFHVPHVFNSFPSSFKD